MRGKILQWDNGKGLRTGLYIPEKQVASLTKQGKGVVYILDDDYNIKIADGKKVVGMIELKNAKIIGFQD
jgi:hypothetical protein